MNNNARLFNSWPIPQGMKNFLSWDEKWPDAFAIGSEGLALLLKTLSEELKGVDYFINLDDIQQFFDFLKKLIETKPFDSQVLKEINTIHADIFEKMTSKKRFNSNEAAVVEEYLSFLKFLFKPDYRYLLTQSEITINANDFLTLSKIRFNSTNFLTTFRHTLLASFECNKFLNDPKILLDVISNLVKSNKGNSTENNERAAMQLLDILGVLTNRLQHSQDLSVNLSAVDPIILKKSRFIYRKFKPFVENKLLKYSYYKFFLAQAYQYTENLTQLCQTDAYRRRCISEYDRFIDSYHCGTDQFPSFLIDIKHNNQSSTDLAIVCTAMRETETFVPWMKKNFDLKPNYNRSQLTLHVSDSEKDFLIDKFLFEYEDSLKKSYSVKASYFLAQNPNQVDVRLVGSAYTFTLDSLVLAHEYIHHLTALFINNLELDLTLTEGLAELTSAGICSERHIRDLRNFVNDTFIFEFFKMRKFPFYVNSLKWAAYLVNEQPERLKEFLIFLQNNDTEGFYAYLDEFIDYDATKQAFVTWSNQQISLCNSYLNHYPNGHQPPIIYLKEISAHLNQTQTLGSPKVILAKRDLSSQAAKNEMLEEPSNNFHDFLSQELEIGIPLRSAAFFAGMASPLFDDLGVRYKYNYPSLPLYINNGLKPFIFAAMSASLNTVLYDQTVSEVDEKFARLFTYFMMNYLGVVIAQPLNKKLAEKIQNRVLNFFVQMMTWTLLWNPSLFLAEGSRFFSTLFLQITQALCFKAGEESYQFGKRICSPFWNKNKPRAFDIEDAFIESDSDQEHFENKLSLRFS